MKWRVVMSKELTPLQALENIRKGRGLSHLFTYYEEELNIIETALKRLEKIETTTHSVLREDISNKLKALEIIKNKHINCIDIITTKDYEEYIDEFNRFVKGNNPLNREEYELLKEMLI